MPSYLDVQKLRARQPLPEPRFGQEMFHPQAEIPSFGEAIGAGFGSTSLVVGAAKIIMRDRAENDEVDPSFDRAQFFRDHPEHNWFLDIAAFDEDAFQSVLSAPNQGALEAMISNQQTVLGEIQAMAEHPWGAVIGGLGGMASDIPLILIPGTMLAEATKVTATSVRAARLMGAARSAGVGALEGSAFVAAESLRDRTIGLEEIAAFGAAGAVIGGAAGAVFPGSMGVRVNRAFKAGTDAAEAARGKSKVFYRSETPAPAREPEPQSLGAAATPTNKDNVVKRTASLGGRFLRDHIPFSESLRSVKQRWENIGIHYDEPSVRNFQAEVIRRLARHETLTEGERESVVREIVSAQENMEHYFGGAWLGQITETSRIEYTSLANDLADGFMKNARRDPVFPSRLSWLRRLRKPGLTPDEFDKIVHRVRMFDSHQLESDLVLQKYLPGDLTPEEFARVRKAVRNVVDPTDEVMNRGWAKAHELGFVDTPEPPFAFYSPQLILREEALANLTEFKDLIKYNLGMEPSSNWLVENGFAQPGQFLKDLEHSAQREAMDEWMFRHAEEIREAAEQNLQKARSALSAAEDEALETALKRYDPDVAEARRKVTYWTDRLDKAKTLNGEAQAQDNLMKAEQRLSDLMDDVEQARAFAQTRQGLLRELDYALRRTKEKKARQKLEAAQRKIQQAETGVEKAEKKVAAGPRQSDFDPDAVVDEFVSNMTRGLEIDKNLFGFVTAERDIGRAGTSGRLMPRQIDLTRSLASFDPRLEKYFEMNPGRLYRSWFAHMAPRFALQETFGTQDLEEYARPFISAMPVALQKDAAEDVKALLDRMLLNHLAEKPELRLFSSMMRNYATGVFLPLSLLSQIPDIGTAHAALGMRSMSRTLGTAARAFTTGGPVHRAMERSTDPMLRALIKGFEQAGAMAGRSHGLFELDPLLSRKGVGPIDSFAHRSTRKMYSGSEITAQTVLKLNGMRRWHDRIAEAFRYAALEQLRQFGKKGWDTIDPVYQGVLRGRGIGPKQLKRLHSLFEKTGKFDEEGVFTPDLRRWSENDFRMLERAVEATGNAAVITPRLGDVPRVMNDPLGAMFLQFTSWAYSVQGKMIRRAAQDPTFAPYGQGLALSMALTFFATGIRAHLVGRGQEWTDNWSTPEGRAQNVYELWSRSPLSVAWSTAFMELAVSQLGAPMNRVLDGTGFAVPSTSRFQSRSGLSRTLGPGYASLENTLRLVRNSADALSGDQDGWQKFQTSLKQVIPGARLLTLYGIDRMLGEPD